MLAVLSWRAEGQTLYLNGELDRDSLLPLWQQRIQALKNITVLDVSELNRVDSAGLALLVHLLGDLQIGKQPLTLVGITDRLQTLITLYNLQAIITGSPAS